MVRVVYPGCGLAISENWVFPDRKNCINCNDEKILVLKWSVAAFVLLSAGLALTHKTWLISNLVSSDLK